MQLTSDKGVRELYVNEDLKCLDFIFRVLKRILADLSNSPELRFNPDFICKMHTTHTRARNGTHAKHI